MSIAMNRRRILTVTHAEMRRCSVWIKIFRDLRSMPTRQNYLCTDAVASSGQAWHFDKLDQGGSKA